jgi:hypothetical protein
MDKMFSSFRGKSSAGSSVNANDPDFDEEARNLWARLNLDPKTKGGDQWNALDAIYRHATGGGSIYVGNQTAAQDINILSRHNITHVVNCTHGDSGIPCYHKGKLRYYVFPIAQWGSFVNRTDESILQFTGPMFDFIEGAISKGESVLVHCLAGAHRAGTTGCACLVHFADMEPNKAIMTAKRLRPIIDPIGSLPELLVRLQKARTGRKKNALIGAVKDASNTR